MGIEIILFIVMFTCTVIVIIASVASFFESRDFNNCPECGYSTIKLQPSSSAYYVQCNNCGARTDYFTEAKKARFAWNNKMVRPWEGIKDYQHEDKSFEGKNVKRENDYFWK